MLPNIYLVGKAGAGKTYLATYLINNYGYSHSKMAHSVYMLAEKYLGMNPEKKDRHLLQFLGTEIGRNEVERDIWINRMVDDVYIVARTAKELYNKDMVFVADDVRFDNEHQVLESLGWVGIYLEVDENIRLKRLVGRDGDAQVSTLNHSSETALEEFKDELIKIDVSGTLEESYKNLETVLEMLRRN